jgi:hypothetical protein
VHWMQQAGKAKQPERTIAVLVGDAGKGDGIEFVDESGRQSLKGSGTGYRWSDAFSWGQMIVVGHDTGASVFSRSGKGWVEDPSPALAKDGTGHAAVQMPIDTEGVMSYIPAEGGHAGSRATARYVDGKWSLLDDAAQWPGNFLYLSPLVDGSVLQIIAGNDGAARLAITGLSSLPVDKKHVLELLDALDSTEHDKRAAAFAELSTYGTGLWPILEAEMDNQPPGVREKMTELLKNKTEPTLGEMSLVDSQLKLAARSNDGSALFYSRGGVAVTNVDGDQTLASPAWISIRPGQAVRLMLGRVWSDMVPAGKRFYAISGGDWIISDEGTGPQEIIGTFETAPLLRKNEIKYSELIGVDRQNRWLFCVPGSREKGQHETLVLDPTLPPVTPRLPVWAFKAAKGKVGCDNHDWPAYEDAGGNVWTIREDGFQLLDKKKDQFITDPAALAKLSEKSAVKGDGGSTVVTMADGSSYRVGDKTLQRIGTKGTIEWALPPEARGTQSPRLMRDGGGHLWLWNEPGRVIRLRETGQPAQPFKWEGAFSHNIPNEVPARLWIDPAGRLVFANGGDQLTICFTGGVVPAALADKIPAGDAMGAD